MRRSHLKCAVEVEPLLSDQGDALTDTLQVSLGREAGNA
jgi:hypothetical protein